MRILNPIHYLSYLELGAEIRIRNSLGRTTQGFPIDLVTPIIPDQSKPDLGRIQRRHEMAEAIGETGYPWLDDVELAQREKIGSYSIMLPYDERKTEVYSYFKVRALDINYYAFTAAVDRVRDRVHGKLSTASLNTAFDSMPRGTNLGLPWVSSDKRYLPEVKAYAQQVIRENFRVSVDPAILYWRGQPRGIGEIPKQRTVWGDTHWKTCLELMIQIPLLERLRSDISFSAIVSLEAVDLAVTKVLDTAIQDVWSVDFSGYDASLPRELIRAAYDILKSWFKDSDHALISFCERALLTQGLLTPEGILIDRDGGMTSGSGLTNLIDSICQLIAMEYVAIRTNNQILVHLVQGDDGVVSFQNPWSLEENEKVMLELGLRVSADKGGVSREQVYYLQNVHSKEYRVNGVTVHVRPLMRVLNGMLSYERFRKSGSWNGYDDTLRWWQQLETARWHPKFFEAVSLFRTWDKYSREYNADQIVKRAGGLEMAKSALSEKPFPYGKESISGLRNFEIVHILNYLNNGEHMLTGAKRAFLGARVKTSS